MAKAWKLAPGVILLLLIVAWKITPQISAQLKILFPGKTLWDYIEVFILPFLSAFPSAIVVALLVWFLDSQAKAREQKQMEEREASQKRENQEQQHIREQDNKEEILQRYFDRVSALILDKQVLGLAKAAAHLGNNYKDPIIESAGDIIRAQTLSVLRIFSGDEEKKTSVVRFLIESRVLWILGISLSEADLSKSRLDSADLAGLDLRNADLKGANLSGARLFGCDLSDANLSDAKLYVAHLGVANLSPVMVALRRITSRSDINYNNTDRLRTILRNATLLRADLTSADLNEADLSGANLIAADLTLANLTSANLNDANLMGANLRDVRWNESTIWPDLRMFKEARNIPEALRNKLGI